MLSPLLSFANRPPVDDTPDAQPPTVNPFRPRRIIRDPRTVGQFLLAPGAMMHPGGPTPEDLLPRGAGAAPAGLAQGPGAATPNRVDQMIAKFRSDQAAPAKLPDFDPPRKQHPDDLTAAGLDPNRLYTNAELEEALNLRRAGMMPDPNAASIARLRSQATAQDTMANRMGALPVPQEEEFNMPALPQRATEAIPQRQERPSTFGRAAAALAGLIAPQAAGEFGAAELGGEQEAGQLRYSDALTRYKLATARDDQEYDDALQRSQMTGQNTMRNQQIRYGNQQNRYNAAVDEIMRRGGASQAGDEASQLTALGAAQQPYNILGARAENIGARQKAAQLMEQYQGKADLAAAQRQNALLMERERGLDAQGRANTMAAALGGRTTATQTGQNERQQSNLATQAAKVGMQYTPPDPNIPGSIPRFAPLPTNQLPPALRAKMGSAPMHEKALRAQLWHTTYAPQIAVATTEYHEAEMALRSAKTGIPALKREARLAQKALDDYVHANPLAERMEDESKRATWTVLHNAAVNARQKADGASEDAKVMQADRDAARKRLDTISTPPQDLTERAAPPRAASPRPLDEATAHTILQQAGGDKAKARKIAKQRGYSF